MSRIKKALLKIRTSLFKGAFIHNPVLTQAIGIFAIIGGAVSLRYALALTVTLGAVLITCECMAALLLKKLPRWLRVAFYTLIGSVIIYAIDPFIGIIAHDGARALPLYFCLMGVNALIAVRCERFAVKNKLRYCLVDAFSCAAGFGAVAITIGLFRQIISDSTLAGKQPFIAFILLGFLAAAHRAVVMNFYPKEKTDTFSMKSCDDKITFKDPGLGRKSKKSISSPGDDFDIIKLRGNEKEGE